MINKKMRIWIPKKIAPFYYKDIDFKIENYVLDKDITNIIGNGHLIKKAIKLRHVFYWLLLMFILLCISLVLFFFIKMLIYSGSLNYSSSQLVIIKDFGISAIILWVLGWIWWILMWFGIIIFYTNKQCKLIVDYFNKLVKENKLVSDLSKYPVVFIMAFYYKNRSQFPIDYPNTYPRFACFFAILGPSIFFDRLYEYINRKTNHLSNTQDLN
ncbi:MAG: hypothetical protein IIT78_03080 [Mycoplasmataceae bacterium]|nr:hypothetical protein [Mycoplasmataceae bacterium]